MREGGRVDHDEAHALAARLVDALHQLVLGVGLEAHQLVAGLAGTPLKRRVDRGEGLRAIVVGLPGTEEIEIGAMEDQNPGHRDLSGASPGAASCGVLSAG